MKRPIFLFLLLCFLFTAAVSAQEKSTSVSKVVRLNRAPVNKDVLQVKLPPPVEYHLSNGLTLLVVERHKLPTVTLDLIIKSGALSDPKDLPGLASFTADMVREGTTNRTSAQIASEIGSLGATLRTSADFGSSDSILHVDGLSESTEKLLGLLSDIAVNACFPGEELEKYRKRQLANLEQQRSEPYFLANEKLQEVLYRDFPAAVVSATTESVKAVKPNQLKQFRDTYYVPGNAILGIAGDVDPKQTLALAEKYFGAWKGNLVKAEAFEKLPTAAPAKVYLVHRPDSVQTNILAGEYGVRRNGADFIPLTVTNRILGGGPTGRLFLNLREEKGYTYGAYSYFLADVYPGPWIASTEVRNAVTDSSIHELLSEFKRIREEPVPEAELDESRHAIVARFALSLERTGELLNDWMTVERYGLSKNYWDEYPAEVAKVDQKTVQAMARKYLNSAYMQLVCVGNGKEILPILQKYGDVEISDANGKPVSKESFSPASTK